MVPDASGPRRPAVLMLVGAYYPELSGGALQCRTLVRALAHAVRFGVLTTTRHRERAGTDWIDGVPIHRVYLHPAQPATKLVAGLRLLQQLPRLLRRYDIVHFHGFTQKMLLILPLARLAGCRLLGKMTSVGLDDPVTLRSGLGGRLRRRVLEMADVHVTLSPAMTARFDTAALRGPRVAFIPNGVDGTRFRPARGGETACLRARLGIPADAMVIVSVAFWSLDKGLDVLVDAWLRARTTARTPSALLVIGATSGDHVEVDPGLLTAARARIAAAGAAEAFSVVERTDEVAEHLRACDVFVLPSRREGLPNALLEAMATGLPCVVSALPGVTDWLVCDGDNGLLVPIGDARALTDALAGLLDAPDRRHRLAARARTTVLEQCALDTIAARYLAVYRELARRA